MVENNLLMVHGCDACIGANLPGSEMHLDIPDLSDIQNRIDLGLLVFGKHLFLDDAFDYSGIPFYVHQIKSVFLYLSFV